MVRHCGELPQRRWPHAGSMASCDVLIIISDQLTWRALRCYADTTRERANARTPNIERIAAAGVRFAQAYTPYPLCQPARAAWWTGQHPHQTGVTSNGGQLTVPTVAETLPCLGQLFADAGYDAVHFGKDHAAGALRGFRIVPLGKLPVEGTPAWPVGNDSTTDRHTTSLATAYLRTPGNAPRLTVVDLINPHDICQWVGHNRGAHVDQAVPGELPALPANFCDADLAKRPRPVQYICCAHNRQAQAAEWSDENFRYYLAAYDHYIERVDAEIGLVLNALEASGRAERTTIVFMADHGDSMVAHGLVTKHTSFYEETTRIPFMFAGVGITGHGRVVHEALTSQLDLLPTLCDLAGIQTPMGLWGRSLVPWLSAERDGSPHDYVASEWYSEWGFTIEPGRMIRSARYKYTRYREGEDSGICEELYDLIADPGETRTLIAVPEHAAALEQHRRLLRDHITATGDNFLTTPWKADARWRAHAPGCKNHRGLAAPDEFKRAQAV
jgi:choline-sulfatase